MQAASQLQLMQEIVCCDIFVANSFPELSLSPACGKKIQKNEH